MPISMNTIVTGGAGFVGSHLVDRLIELGHSVWAIDNLFTGTLKNLQQWDKHPQFHFLELDISTVTFQTLCEVLPKDIHEIYHLACPASPDQYWRDPVYTMQTSFNGTLVMLELADAKKARVLFTSTSEIYGDPLISPQPESYFGNVNTFGPRACYDEAKRISETLCREFMHRKKVEVRVARLFNTFGPRLSVTDGRVVSNFIVQTINGESLTIYGDGKQTRSLIYVSDIIDGLLSLMHSDVKVPVNLGATVELSVLEIGKAIWQLLRKDDPKYTFLEAREDDPRQRRPDTTRACQLLGWKPQVDIYSGLDITMKYFQSHMK